MPHKHKYNQWVFCIVIVQIGNAVIDDNATDEGMYDYYWTHALNSDETNAGINEYCGYGSGNFSATCFHYQSQSGSEYGEIDIYNIYAPFCDGSIQKPATGSVSLSFLSNTGNYNVLLFEDMMC
ncbi:unnamed protein product [Lactuca saligna]|uniref:Uncharacterized protein n=1 Tax=Lactuca saligna TaxID=75948 RepID=A0AA35Y7N3_LACSI|nr:unnamed protein product [Lactuca saligna]